MPLIKKYAGITATGAARLGGPLPSTSGLVFNAFFGVSAAKSVNRAPAGSAWSAIGSGPTYLASYARMEPDTNAIRTAVTNTTTAYTIMGVFRRVTGGVGASARIIATNPTSVILWSINPTTGAMSLTGSPVTGAATLTIAGDLDEFRFCVARIGGNQPTTIRNLTDDTISVDGSSGLVSSNGLNTIDLTGGAATTNTLNVDWAWCGIFEGIVGEAAEDEYYDWVQGPLRGFRGISC